jgi:ssDNA-binding Zn-finger/Zn-ribbon topoisomerase 1
MSYQATCTKAACKYTESYKINPGMRKCPKCGSAMTAKKS